MSRTSLREGNGAPVEIGIFSETTRLRTAAIYGGPGTAALLASKLPETISLFHEHMDVRKARVEMDSFAAALEGHGVEVIKIRNMLAEHLSVSSPSPYSREQTVAEFVKKASHFEQKYQIDSGMPMSVFKENLDYLLDKDIEELGAAPALSLAYHASLVPDIPAANMLYARDQTNVALDRRIVSSMAREIRKPEPAMFEKIYRRLVPDEPITIPSGETFEGGDLYVHDNTVMIGVGARTTSGAAEHIFEELGNRKGVKYAIVSFDTNGRSFEELQQTMHLDTFSMPVSAKQIVVCDIEASKREVIEVRIGSDGKAERFHTHKSFPRYLKDEGNEIVSVSVDEQKTYACNFLNIDERIAILPTDQNSGLNKSLSDYGKILKASDMRSVLSGSGAAHCVTSSLRRA